MPSSANRFRHLDTTPTATSRRAAITVSGPGGAARHAGGSVGFHAGAHDCFQPLRRKDLRDPPLSAGASADPAGLTARARPEARPEIRAANLQTRALTVARRSSWPGLPAALAANRPHKDAQRRHLLRIFEWHFGRSMAKLAGGGSGRRSLRIRRLAVRVSASGSMPIIVRELSRRLGRGRTGARLGREALGRSPAAGLQPPWRPGRAPQRPRNQDRRPGSRSASSGAVHRRRAAIPGLGNRSPAGTRCRWVPGERRVSPFPAPRDRWVSRAAASRTSPSRWGPELR